MGKKKQPYVDELEALLPWSTMKDDMCDCGLILHDETRIYGSDYLKLFEKIDLSGVHRNPRPDDIVKITFAGWMIRIQRHFRQKYGEEIGKDIAEKAIARLIAPSVKFPEN